MCAHAAVFRKPRHALMLSPPRPPRTPGGCDASSSPPSYRQWATNNRCFEPASCRASSLSRPLDRLALPVAASFSRALCNEVGRERVVSTSRSRRRDDDARRRTPRRPLPPRFSCLPLLPRGVPSPPAPPFPAYPVSRSFGGRGGGGTALSGARRGPVACAVFTCLPSGWRPVKKYAISLRAFRLPASLSHGARRGLDTQSISA